MNRWLLLSVLACLGPAAAVRAQEPPAAPPKVLSMFGLTPEQRSAWRARFAVGLKNISSASDQAAPADSASGVAARIKQDEAEAKTRCETVRYLGTVDCRYWPDAERALIQALRADRNEAVRWEAAAALQHGGGCTPKIIEALAVCVSDGEQDGHPAERSARVRDAAAVALARCIATIPDGGKAGRLPSPAHACAIENGQRALSEYRRQRSTATSEPATVVPTRAEMPALKPHAAPAPKEAPVAAATPEKFILRHKLFQARSGAAVNPAADSALPTPAKLRAEVRDTAPPKLPPPAANLYAPAAPAPRPTLEPPAARPGFAWLELGGERE